MPSGTAEEVPADQVVRKEDRGAARLATISWRVSAADQKLEGKSPAGKSAAPLGEGNGREGQAEGHGLSARRGLQGQRTAGAVHARQEGQPFLPDGQRLLPVLI